MKNKIVIATICLFASIANAQGFLSDLSNVQKTIESLKKTTEEQISPIDQIIKSTQPEKSNQLNDNRSGQKLSTVICESLNSSPELKTLSATAKEFLELYEISPKNTQIYGNTVIRDTNDKLLEKTAEKLLYDKVKNKDEVYKSTVICLETLVGTDLGYFFDINGSGNTFALQSHEQSQREVDANGNITIKPAKNNFRPKIMQGNKIPPIVVILTFGDKQSSSNLLRSVAPEIEAKMRSRIADMQILVNRRNKVNQGIID